ncbi:F-box-like protein [Rhynchospora pubera]|uniref:F-box-like protein n=1 Tax=Rhynchospora pubera TaxID=906938 RepID=A0AAV8HLK6_9POAL|nr:F-box-like protein [Rhynchospora pubera]
MHVETASRISGSLALIEREITGKYLRFPKFEDAINLLKSMELNFEDICSVLFSAKLSVQANLIGLHYSVNFLRVKNKDVRDAVVTRRVAERRVHLKWFRATRYFDLLHMPEQRCYLTRSIWKIAMDKEFLALLNQGHTANIREVRIGTLPDEGVKQTTYLRHFFGVFIQGYCCILQKKHIKINIAVL